MLLKILPIFLGGAAVIQAGMNRMIADANGMAWAGLINGLMVVGLALIVFAVAYTYPGLFPDVIPFKKAKGVGFQWWYLIPGVIGFCLVFLLPLIVMRVGALPVFLAVIAGQIVVSILWDAYYEDIPVSVIRVGGALLTFAGAILAAWGTAADRV